MTDDPRIEAIQKWLTASGVRFADLGHLDNEIWARAIWFLGGRLPELLAAADAVDPLRQTPGLLRNLNQNEPAGRVWTEVPGTEVFHVPHRAQPPAAPPEPAQAGVAGGVGDAAETTEDGL